MDNTLYEYSPIVDRPELTWPNGARVAFYVGLNVEHFEVDKPSTSIWDGTAHLKPDPLNHGWRDYGARVGIWRIMDILQRQGFVATTAVNAEVCEHYPEIIEAGKLLGWDWMAHGPNNSMLFTGVPEDVERPIIAGTLDVLVKSLG